MRGERGEGHARTRGGALDIPIAQSRTCVRKRQRSHFLLRLTVRLPFATTIRKAAEQGDGDAKKRFEKRGSSGSRKRGKGR